MNKKEFLREFTKELKGISEEERQDILSDYEEHFMVGLEEGKSEEELAESLGDPKLIAKQFKTDLFVKKAEKMPSMANIFRAVFTAIGLSFFSLIFILPTFITLIAVLGALFGAAIAITAVGITGIFASLVGWGWIFNFMMISPVILPIALFTFIGVTALGLLFFIGDIYLAKIFYRVIIKCTKFILNVIRDKG